MVCMEALERITGVQIGAVVFHDPLTGEYEENSHKLYLETSEEEAKEYKFEISEDIRCLLARKYKQYLDADKK